MVNVPAISDRTVRRNIASSGVTIGSNIQVCTCICPLCVILGRVKVTYPLFIVKTSVLAKAAASDPGAKWWINGCDVVGGL